jgi:hypothetical protein
MLLDCFVVPMMFRAIGESGSRVSRWRKYAMLLLKGRAWLLSHAENDPFCVKSTHAKAVAGVNLAAREEHARGERQGSACKATPLKGCAVACLFLPAQQKLDRTTIRIL